jgi:hypothetical protein
MNRCSSTVGVELGTGSGMASGAACVTSTVPLPVVAQPASKRISSADIKRKNTNTPQNVVFARYYAVCTRRVKYLPIWT